MELIGEAMIGVMKSATGLMQTMDSQLDKTRRREADAILNEASLTMTERQNKILQTIKDNSTIQVDDWEKEYDKMKSKVSEGYENNSNQYAGPELKNMAAKMNERARADFAAAGGAYRDARTLAVTGETMAKQVSSGDEVGAWASLSIITPLLNPAEQVKAHEEVRNGLLYNKAMIEADKRIAAGDFNGAMTAANGEYPLSTFADSTIGTELRGVIQKQVQSKIDTFKKTSDDNNALVAQDELNVAFNKGNPIRSQVIAYMDNIGKKGFYDADTETAWWAKGRMLLDNLDAGAGAKQSATWALNAAELRARAANKEFTNAKEYYQIVHTMILDGQLDPSKHDVYYNYFDAEPTPLNIAVDTAKATWGVKDKKGNEMIPRDQQEIAVATMEAYYLKNQDATPDEIKKIGDAITNPALIKAIGQKIVKLSVDTDQDKEGSAEAALALLSSGAVDMLAEKGMIDVFKDVNGARVSFTPDQLKKAVGEAFTPVVKKDIERLFSASGVKLEGMTYQWDENLKAPVFTVKKKDGGSEIYTVRKMTQEYYNENMKDINSKSISQKQKYPRVGEEYLSIIKDVSTPIFTRKDGQMVQVKTTPIWKESYVSLLGYTGRN